MKSIIILFLFLFIVNANSQHSIVKELPTSLKYSIDSKILKEKRDIFVYVPKGFWGMDDTLKVYPITYVLDGESQFLNAYSAIDFLSSSALGNDEMPRTLVVGIPNKNRNRDLTPTKGLLGKDSTTLKITGGGPKFLEFIFTEVEPLLDSLFSVSNHRTIIGHSLGGLIVFEALLNKRAHFDNYLAIDPFLRFDNESYLNRILDTLNSTNLMDENLYVATAETFPTFKDASNSKEDTSDIILLTKSNQKFRESSQNQNWQINGKFKHYPDENHFSVPYIATYEAMKHFYSYFPFKEMIDYCHPSTHDRSDLIERLENHYEEISKRLGYSVDPMESYINSWAFGLSNFNRKDLSTELFDYNIRSYPNKSTVYKSKGVFLQKQGKKEAAIALFKKSLDLKEDKDVRKRLIELEGSMK